MKKTIRNIFLHLPAIACTLSIIILILINPQAATDGIKNGITLLLTTVIPSLFPFLVIASYMASSNAFTSLAGIFEKATTSLFKISASGFIPIVMGFLGGYPVGAKITADLYKANRISQNEAERLLYFTVNSGPAFTITAVGVGMLHNYYAGLILFASGILTSLTLGFFCRFLGDGSYMNFSVKKEKNNSLVFINSVSSGANAIINISAWILTFSCFSAIINQFNFNENLKLFLNAVLEVTNGCKLCSTVASLPLISAILGFGGLAVVAQVSPYFSSCKVSLKNFIVSRILNASLSAFFTSQLLKIIPVSAKAAVIYSTKNGAVGISYTVSATIILLIMCIFFILQVDNRKKVC